METWFKVLFGICAFIGLIIGIATFAGYLGCHFDSNCSLTIEYGVEYYIFGMVLDLVERGIWFGIGIGIPLWILVMIWIARWD